MPRAPKQHTPTPIDGAFGHPSLQRRTKKNLQVVPKNTIFLVFMNKTQVLLFALLKIMQSRRAPRTARDENVPYTYYCAVF